MYKNKALLTVSLLATGGLLTVLLLRRKHKLVPPPPAIDPGTLRFKMDTADLTEDIEDSLNVLAKQMGAAPNYKVVVQGNGGTTRPSLQLYLERMGNIIDYMYIRGKIDKDRFVIKFYSAGNGDVITYRKAIYRR